MKNARSPILALALALILTLALVGCGHTHVWKDATCTTPKTCAECGATEGDPAPHTWKDATCTAPKTCAVCGATEGDPAPHTWKDATCTAPKTCAVCGATEGDPAPHAWEDATCTAPKTCTVCGLTEGDPAPHTPTEADYWTPSVCSVCGEELGPVKETEFEKRGLHADMKLDAPVEYTFSCFTDKTKQTVAKATVTKALHGESFENYLLPDGETVWNLEPKDGYEWQIVHMELDFGDENSNYYGYSIYLFEMSYFSDMTDDLEEMEKNKQETDYGTVFVGTVDYKGQEYDSIAIEHFANGPWEPGEGALSHCTAYVDVAVQVPVGYDGLLVGVLNRGEAPDDAPFYDLLTPECPIFHYFPD